MFALSFAFAFTLFQHGRHEIGVLDLAPERRKVGAAWVNPEDNGQFILHGGPEDCELLWWELQLQLVVGPEEWVFLGDGGRAPLILDLFLAVHLRLELACSLAHLVVSAEL
jgi:hypothetical protein